MASSAGLTQTASCPAGFLTPTGSATFTQSATRTTTCPSGPYGAPSTSTSAWSPTPAQACPTPVVRKLPIDGASYSVEGPVFGPVGRGTASSAQFSLRFNPDGTYTVTQTVGRRGGPRSTTLDSGTWLPGGRSASDFTITMSASGVYTESPYSSLGSGAACNVPLPVSGAGNVGLQMCSDAVGGSNSGGGQGSEAYGTITVTITDRTNGTQQVATFKEETIAD